MDMVRVFGQAMSLILVPAIILIGMVLTTVWHDIIIVYLAPLGALGAFFTIFLSIVAFIGFCAVFPYFWVKTQGFGILAVNR